MALEKYRAKRNFSVTPEPRGKVARGAKPALSFVVQKHAASHLHYDFRLELNGVLLSWAVPKGPSLDPADKRLAMHVEDHPLEYGGFEGVIPERQYGAGTVMLWDRGTWTPKEDPVAGYAKGRLKFELDGEKLKGGWTLVRTRGSKYGGKTGDQAWLLIKEGDRDARPGGPSIVETAPDSVATQRGLDDIKSARTHVWQ
ncbi:MAG: DNA polymerase ligase N-terminal domain-containing protein, partial [Casimicrobiaceae bacterium]